VLHLQRDRGVCQTLATVSHCLVNLRYAHIQYQDLKYTNIKNVDIKSYQEIRERLAQSDIAVSCKY